MKKNSFEQSKPSDDTPEITEIRAIRAAISAECDHEPWKLVAQMRDFQVLSKPRRHAENVAKRP